MPMTSGRVAPFGALVAVVLAAACSSSSGGNGGGKPDSGAESGSEAGEDASGDTGGGGDGSQQDASEGGSTTDSPSEATSGDGGLCDLGSSLVLWLQGDVGLASSGNPATVTWTDQSAAMNNASSGTGQTSVPTIDTAVVNGHTAVKFDGTNFLNIPDATSLQFGTTSFAVMLVLSSTTQTAEAGAGTGFTIFSKLGPAISGSTGLALQVIPGGFQASDYQSSQVTANTATFGDGSFHVVGMVRNGTTLQLRLDGSMLASGTFSTNVSEAMKAVALGASSTGAPAFAGDIAEVIAVNGALADPACLESYLKTKYGL
jgi:hypothetical protein